jgi:O-methyltransferase
MLLARRMAMFGLSQPILLCDTFGGVVKAGANDPHYVGGEHADTSIAIVEELAFRITLSNYRLSAGIFPEYRPAVLDNGSIGFCHIDVDTYTSAKDCFDFVWPRMIPGGVVVFDDYGSSTTSGVAKLVDELSSGVDGVWQYNLNGHAVAIRLPAA